MKLQKIVLEYVMARDIDMEAFNAWCKTQKGIIMHNWQVNCEIIIPYHVYEMWWRDVQDKSLLDKLREIIPSA